MLFLFNFLGVYLFSNLPKESLPLIKKSAGGILVNRSGSICLIPNGTNASPISSETSPRMASICVAAEMRSQKISAEKM
ncbi:MAG: hypothetical protein H6Q41_3948 [Deltaproteobacteria bacterium]|jgi:hypothetical protein|nr:hypothetical protein [Deltaproteobacteria bacterium]